MEASERTSSSMSIRRSILGDIVGSGKKEGCMKSVAKEYSFFLRPVPDYHGKVYHRDGLPDEIELHLRHTVYPEADPYYDASEDCLEFDLGEHCDSNGDVSWWIGDLEKGRQQLLDLGMVEDPSLTAGYDSSMFEEISKMEKK